MLGLRRRTATTEAAPVDPSPIRADLRGATVTGQVAVGEHIVQIQADAGARVTYVAPDARPVLRLRASIRRLPRDFPELLGRRDELEAVGTALRGSAPVEVAGEAGIGKTALLRHLAHRAEGSAPEGIVFTGCGRQPVEDVLQFLVECCYESDAVFVPTPAQLREHLAERRVLVVLDDVDLPREQVEALLDAAPQCLFLLAAPSRRLWGEGRSVALGGLPLPAALALLERELVRVLEPDERPGAEAFCAAVDGHPLRILQAAALMREGRALPPAPWLGETLAGSLSDAERAVLGPLAATPQAPVPLGQVRAAGGVDDAEAVLERLERRGLVQSHSPRYSIAGEPLVDGGPWLERMLATAVPPRSPEETPALLALLDAGARAERWHDVLRVARQAGPPLTTGGRVGAWGVVSDHALVAARAAGDRAGEGWALHERGSRALCLGDRELAAAALGEALALREQLGDAPGAALTRHNLAQLGGGAGGVPPHNGGPPPGPRPRWPWIAGGLGVVAAAAVAVALAADGGGSSPTAPPASPAVQTVGAGGAQGGGTQSAATDTTGQGGSAATPAGGGGGSGTNGGGGGRTTAPPPPAAAATVDQTPVSFGDQAVEHTSGPRSIDVANQGSGPAQLGAVTAGGADPGDFTIGSDDCSGATLDAGESCKVTVTFTPPVPGPRTATVDFADLGNGSTASVPLSGNGSSGKTQDNVTPSPKTTSTSGAPPPSTPTPSRGQPKPAQGAQTTGGPG
ncbi:MAG TPA: choice-of-anchor D domain-containing protein [Solirubrobacteraceae bacterium]|jgi:hypothetical protein|nr:choice-of-anchor D domain-containing protein [Solirubrobacteraceae bacterium]